MTDKILIVDDEQSILDTLKDILEDEGYEVTPAFSGTEAVEVIKAQDFNVVIMDIKMPGMNGVESFIEMKKIRPGVKAIMITAYSIETLIQQAIDEGVHGVMKKPLDISSLFDKIDTIRKKGAGGVILIADDDRDLCDNLNNILSDEGFSVITAYNGKEAVEKAEKYNCDVLLLDMKLPVMNGLEVYRHIKEVSPESIAIIISGYAREMNDLIQQMLNESAFTCLNKPINMKSLLEVLETACAAKREGTYKKLKGQ